MNDTPGYDTDTNGLNENTTDIKLSAPSETEEKITDIKWARWGRGILFISFGIVAIWQICFLPSYIHTYWQEALKAGLFDVPHKGLFPLMGIALAVLAAVPLTIFISLSNLVRSSHEKETNNKEQQGIVTLTTSIVSLISDLVGKIAQIIKK